VRVRTARARHWTRTATRDYEETEEEEDEEEEDEEEG